MCPNLDFVQLHAALWPLETQWIKELIILFTDHCTWVILGVEGMWTAPPIF